MVVAHARSMMRDINWVSVVMSVLLFLFLNMVIATAAHIVGCVVPHFIVSIPQGSLQPLRCIHKVEFSYCSCACAKRVKNGLLMHTMYAHDAWWLYCSLLRCRLQVLPVKQLQRMTAACVAA